MKTLKDFHDLQCHVLLLAVVFEIFRNINLKYHWIYSRDYLSASLSWDAMLKMTKIKLELITDPGMCMFFGKGTRGGISYILIFLILNITKPTINIWNLMTHNKNQNISQI